jgi:branched-chain amino acid transport system permease protein
LSSPELDRQDRARGSGEPHHDLGLGINTTLVYGSLRARSLLAGLAGPGGAGSLAGIRDGFLDPDRVVHRYGHRRHGLGGRCLVGALLIGLVRSFGSIGFPLFTDGLMFLFMTVILITKPSGLFGKEL